MAAAAREAEEEIGVRIEAQDMVFSSVMHRLDGEERVDFFVHVYKWQGEPFNAEPEKCDDLLWAEMDQLPANTVPYVRQALKNHWNEIKFDEYGW